MVRTFSVLKRIKDITLLLLPELWLCALVLCVYSLFVVSVIQHQAEKSVKQKRFQRKFFFSKNMTLAVSTAAPSPLRDTTAATPVCAAEVAPQEFLDEAFQPFGEPEGEEEDEEVTNTVWHLLFSIHIPLLLLRLRRSFYGLTAFVRSILFGQCFQFLMAYFSPSPTTWETLSPWLEPLLGNPHSKDPHAWPPPTLRVLAILTVLAFIVHPDGMTWIMLGKLRYVLLPCASVMVLLVFCQSWIPSGTFSPFTYTSLLLKIIV